MHQLLMMGAVAHRSRRIHARRAGPANCRVGTATAAWAIVFAATAALLIADPASAQPAGTACFQVLPGQTEVLPQAPLLLNTCTGETFVLIRAKRPGPKSAQFEWLEIAKPGAGSSESTKGAPAATGPARDNCFTYNGRSYCP